MRSNQSTITAELGKFHVPHDHFHYRGKDDEGHQKWKEHTFESRGFFVVLLSLLKSRSLKALSKVKALCLIMGLVEKAMVLMDWTKPIMALATNKQGAMKSHELTFSAQGKCNNFAAFLMVCPGAAALWVKL